MASRLKKTLILMPIFIILALVIGSAEVKLRIYLKDGTLRAGNLVKDEDKKFVILTQSGRMEIPKKDIMFVNGKTLAQWQDRPDKFFQTEIIPEELPKPGYVNAKAALESAPKPSAPAQPLPPLKQVMNAVPEEPEYVEDYGEEEEYEEVPLDEVFTEEPSPEPQQTASAFPLGGPMALPNQQQPMKETPVVEQQAVVKPVAKKSEAPAVVKKSVKPKKVVKSVVAEKPAKKKPIKAKVAKVVQSKPIVVSVKKPRRYSRKRFADYHYKRALAYLDKGAKGQARQELHYATTLDRKNSESAFLLGKLYFESGVYERSKKLFKHPELKKRTEVLNLIEEMEKTTVAKTKERNIFYASASAGLLTMLPLVALARRFRKPAKPSRVIEAEEISLLETTEESVTAVETLEKEPEEKPVPPEPAFKKIQPKVEPPVPPVSEEVPPPVPEPVVQKPEPPKEVPPPKPVVFPFPETAVPPVSQGPSFATKPPEPPKPPEPVKPPPAEFFEKPKPAPEPPAEFFEKIKPVEVPVPDEPALSPEEEHAAILKLSQQVDSVISLGHDYAAEGNFDQANREYRTAIALNPACLEGYLGLGFLYFMNGQWELSMANYVKALEIDPNCADAHYGIGRVFLETNGEDQAVPEFERTLQIDPTFEDARETLTALGKLE